MIDGSVIWTYGYATTIGGGVNTMAAGLTLFDDKLLKYEIYLGDGPAGSGAMPKQRVVKWESERFREIMRALDAKKAVTQKKSEIGYSVINREVSFGTKISFDVRVQLVDGRLPNKAELESVAKRLYAKDRDYEREFMLFYLPGQVVDAGAYAFANRNPTLDVQIVAYNMPEEYAGLLERKTEAVGLPIPKGPSDDAFEVRLDIAIQWQGKRPIIVGKTNLPDGTKIMTSVSRKKPPFMGQGKAVVSAGSFTAGPFGSSAGLPPGEYEAGATMPYSQIQLAKVRAVVGDDGEKISGDLVKRGQLGATVSRSVTFKVQ